MAKSNTQLQEEVKRLEAEKQAALASLKESTAALEEYQKEEAHKDRFKDVKVDVRFLQAADADVNDARVAIAEVPDYGIAVTFHKASFNRREGEGQIHRWLAPVAQEIKEIEVEGQTRHVLRARRGRPYRGNPDGDVMVQVQGDLCDHMGRSVMAAWRKACGTEIQPDTTRVEAAQSEADLTGESLPA